MTCVIATTNLRCGELPSTEINEVGLQPIANVLLKYSSLRVERQIGKLDVKLAQEAITGNLVSEQCTPRGWNNLPALPQVELNMLKLGYIILEVLYFSGFMQKIEFKGNKLPPRWSGTDM